MLLFGELVFLKLTYTIIGFKIYYGCMNILYQSQYSYCTREN